MRMAGYQVVYMPNHHRALKSSGCVYQHVIKAQQKIGRALKDSQVVHHIDFNKLNNDIDNLIIFDSKADHTRFHKFNCDFSTLYEVQPNIWKCRSNNICPICKNNKSKDAILCKNCRKNNMKYLNGESNKNYSKKYQVDRQKLKQLIRSYSFEYIGRIFNVTGKTITNWCKHYNLPNTKKQINSFTNEQWSAI